MAVGVVSFVAISPESKVEKHYVQAEYCVCRPFLLFCFFFSFLAVGVVDWYKTD